MADGPLFPVIDGNYRMDAEPRVGIGVVLERDRKRAISLRIPQEDYRLRAGEDTASTPLAPGDYTIRRMDSHFTVEAEGACEPIKIDKAAPVTIVAPERVRAARSGDGVLVRDLVAGRGFHWAKTIDQTLTGDLEFHAPAGSESVVVVDRLPIEEYLTGVITGEMSGECPIEFMKAQAIAARSWLLGQPRSPHPGQPFHWCNDDCCQRYQGTGGWSERAVQAIAECRGQVLVTAARRYCDARYSKSTGGISEDATLVWNENIDGLVSRIDAPKGSAAERFFPVTDENIEEYLVGDWLKDCDCYASPSVVPEDSITRYLGRVDEAGTYFRWTVTRTQDELCESLHDRANIGDLLEVRDLRTGRRGKSGRVCELFVDYLATNGSKKTATLKSEYDIRAGLSTKFLYSSCIVIRAKRNDAGKLLSVDLVGGGWGHGAGLCQIGGLGRALSGQAAEEILMAYYTDVTLERIYE